MRRRRRIGQIAPAPPAPVAPNWGTAVLIESSSSEEAQYPQIAIDSTGNAIAVWQQFEGSRYKIQANRYVLNVGWGTPVTIDTGGTGSAGTPQIAMDPAGNAIAVWLQWNGNRFGIFANRYTAGGSWGTAVAIDTGSSGASANPDIAMDPNGNAIAVWEQYDGTLSARQHPGESVYGERECLGHGGNHRFRRHRKYGALIVPPGCHGFQR